MGLGWVPCSGPVIPSEEVRLEPERDPEQEHGCSGKDPKGVTPLHSHVTYHHMVTVDGPAYLFLEHHLPLQDITSTSPCDVFVGG